MTATPSHETRIAALEAALANRNRRISSSEGVSLKEYFDTRLEAIAKETATAARAMERRLEGMNEFRDTLRDQASRFVTRDEVTAQVKANSDAIAELRTFKDRLEGKASVSAVYVAYAISIVSIVIGVIGLLS